MEEATKVATEEFSENSEDNVEQTVVEENQSSIEDSVQPDFAEKQEEEEKEEEAKYSEKEEEEDKEEEEPKEEKEEDKKEEKNYALLEEAHNELQNKYDELQTQFSALEKDYLALVDFKNQIENAKKDELINSFYMLSDADKLDVIENKANYSLEDIEAKLSVICVRKKVNFTAADEMDSENKTVITNFNLNSVSETVPAWVSALRNTQNGRA